jgi:simple sugar transport system permease protein
MKGLPFHLTKRLESSKSAQIIVPILAVVLSLLLGGMILAGYGYSPFEIYRDMFGGAFGSYYGLSETLVKAIR